jgi:hypothetical protein
MHAYLCFNEQENEMVCKIANEVTCSRLLQRLSQSYSNYQLRTLLFSSIRLLLFLIATKVSQSVSQRIQQQQQQQQRQ